MSVSTKTGKPAVTTWPNVSDPGETTLKTGTTPETEKPSQGSLPVQADANHPEGRRLFPDRGGGKTTLEKSTPVQTRRFGALEAQLARKSHSEEIEFVMPNGATKPLLRLHDQRGNSMDINPRQGNQLCSFVVDGFDLIYSPWRVGFMQANPLMYPFSNRVLGKEVPGHPVPEGVDVQQTLFANGKYLPLQDADFAGKYQGLFLHGFIQESADWETVKVTNHGNGASHLARMRWEPPKARPSEGTPSKPTPYDLFPFPHELTMQHTLRDGKVTIQLTLKNTGTEPMPVSPGFHTYFAYDPKDSGAFINLPADKVYLTDERNVPTGVTEDAHKNWPNASIKLGDSQFDHCFTDLKRDADGKVVFYLHHTEGKAAGKRTKVTFETDNFDHAVLFSANKNDGVFCIEPMSGPTNAHNMAAQGQWNGLKVVPPGESMTFAYSVELEDDRSALLG